MKNIPFVALFICMMCSCVGAQGKPHKSTPVLQKEGKGASRVASNNAPMTQALPDNGKTFNENGWLGIDWGTPITNLGTEKSMSQFDRMGIKAKLYEDKLVARGPANFPTKPDLLMLWGFDNGQLVYGIQLYVVSAPENVPMLCNFVLGNVLEQYGPPDANILNGGLIWQNENTTLIMFCTNYGPVLDWYNTLWLRHNKSFVAHQAIPEEALRENFGEEVPGEGENSIHR